MKRQDDFAIYVKHVCHELGIKEIDLQDLSVLRALFDAYVSVESLKNFAQRMEKKS